MTRWAESQIFLTDPTGDDAAIAAVQEMLRERLERKGATDIYFLDPVQDILHKRWILLGVGTIPDIEPEGTTD